MPLDSESRRELVRRQVKARRDEHDASLSDEDRYKARHKADFYEKVRQKMAGKQGWTYRDSKVR